MVLGLIASLHAPVRSLVQRHARILAATPSSPEAAAVRGGGVWEMGGMLPEPAVERVAAKPLQEGLHGGPRGPVGLHCGDAPQDVDEVPERRSIPRKATPGSGLSAVLG